MHVPKRKIDDYPVAWERNPDRLPLLVKGARQAGKTESIRLFARKHYEHVIVINVVIQKQFKDIFDDGFEVDTVVKNISLRNPCEILNSSSFPGTP